LKSTVNIKIGKQGFHPRLSSSLLIERKGGINSREKKKSKRKERKESNLDKQKKRKETESMMGGLA